MGTVLPFVQVVVDNLTVVDCRARDWVEGYRKRSGCRILAGAGPGRVGPAEEEMDLLAAGERGLPMQK